MERHSNTGVLNVPADITVGRFRSVGVDTVHWQFVVLHLPLAVPQGQLDDGVQRHLEVGQLGQGGVQQERQEAAQGRLVGDDEQVVGGGDCLQ